MNADIFAPVPTFSYNGETLPITEITKSKKITSLSIGYLSKERKVKADGLKGLFGYKKTIQVEKEISIDDPKGISLSFSEGNEGATIRFWEKNEFEKLADNDYDESTLWKRYVMTPVRPYQINFHIGNLKNIIWQ